MAVLQTSQEAIAILEKPANQKEIQRAQRKKRRSQVNTELITDSMEYNRGHRELLEWIKTEVLKDEAVFNQMSGVIKPPFPSNELTQSIFNQGLKIFKAEDRFIKFNFTEQEMEIDAEEYRKKIQDESFWKTQGWSTYKSAIDSILVVDLPLLQRDENDDLIQDSERPEPYYFLLDVDNLWSVEFSKTTIASESGAHLLNIYRIEHIAYTTSDERYIVIDDLHYRSYTKKSGKFLIESESIHGLNYCPAQSFWSTPLNSNTMLRKSNQITGSESELDWYNFYTWAAKYLKLYAPFPIYAAYKPVCNYKMEHEGRPSTVCKNGYHTYQASNGEKITKKCPKCSGLSRPGPGKFMQVKAPQDPQQDPDLLKNPVVVVPAEKVSVDTVNEELRMVEEKIWKNSVGAGDSVMNKEDVNQKQAEAVTDNKHVILYGIKVNFEVIHKFAIDTVFKLRYGDDFIDSIINYGDDYLPDSEEEAMSSYKIAKESGLPMHDLAARRMILNKVKHRNNPDVMERTKILENLEPFKDMTIQEFQEFAKQNPDIVSREDVALKSKFNDLIMRFQREAGDIIVFGNKLVFDRKISVIKEILLGYIRESMTISTDVFPNE